MSVPIKNVVEIIEYWDEAIIRLTDSGRRDDETIERIGTMFMTVAYLEHYILLLQATKEGE